MVSGLHVYGPHPPPRAATDVSTITHMFETFNANQGKKTLQKRVRRSTAMVILAQEIGYGIDECESLSTWASVQ